jgi:hypothetical protein
VYKTPFERDTDRGSTQTIELCKTYLHPFGTNLLNHFEYHSPLLDKPTGPMGDIPDFQTLYGLLLDVLKLLSGFL